VGGAGKRRQSGTSGRAIEGEERRRGEKKGGKERAKKERREERRRGEKKEGEERRKKEGREGIRRGERELSTCQFFYPFSASLLFKNISWLSAGPLVFLIIQSAKASQLVSWLGN